MRRSPRPSRAVAVRGAQARRRRWSAVVAPLATLAVLAGASPPASGPTAAGAAVVQPMGDATATVETTPVLSSGDAADDIGIWADPVDPSRSVVIGNDKGGALEVYDLAGNRIQRIAEGFFGNVDVRTDLATGTGTFDAVAVYRLGVRIYRIDPATRQLSNATDGTGSIAVPFNGEGICMYRSPVTGSLFVFVNARSGRIAQYRLTDTDADGLVEGTKVRDWDVGTEIEGCVADDGLGDLYVSEEDVGIWKYGAEPTAATTPASRVLVDSVTTTGGHLSPDIEGLTIVYLADGTGYLMASSQAASNTANSYAVYERQGANAYLRSFKVLWSTAADGCGRTDGIDALAAPLGPSFPKGIFVCQDNNNTTPNAGFQNFKFVPLERVVGLPTGPPPPNEAPVAAAEVTCSGLTCAASGAGSSDPDGRVVSYAWDFGDGSTAAGPTASHTYAGPGSWTITLTVTDDDGATAQATRPVTVAPQAEAIAFVGRSTSNLNALAHSVAVPAAVVPGDGLLLFASSNTTAAVSGPTGVTGWQLLDTVTTASSVTKVWRKVAATGDAGAVARVTVASTSKVSLTLAAYRGTSVSDPVTAFARAAETGSTTAHSTPFAPVASGASWAVSFWAHKDSTTTALTPPAGLAVRATGTQSGSGRVTTLLADSGAAVPASPYGGLVATAAATSPNASMWTIVLAPA